MVSIVAILPHGVSDREGQTMGDVVEYPDRLHSATSRDGSVIDDTHVSRYQPIP